MILLWQQGFLILYLKVPPVRMDRRGRLAAWISIPTMTPLPIQPLQNHLTEFTAQGRTIVILQGVQISEHEMQICAHEWNNINFK